MLDLVKSRDTTITGLAAGVLELGGQGPRRRTRSELRQECARRGIEFDHSATADELAASLRHAVDNDAWERAAAAHERWRAAQHASALKTIRPGIRF